MDNFKKITAKAYYNLPYDGTSIMHYKSDAFSMNGFDTITSRVGSKGWQYGTATAPQPPRNMIEFFLEQFLGSNFEPNKQSRTIIRIDRLRHNENQDNLQLRWYVSCNVSNEFINCNENYCNISIHITDSLELFNFPDSLQKYYNKQGKEVEECRHCKYDPGYIKIASPCKGRWMVSQSFFIYFALSTIQPSGVLI